MVKHYIMLYLVAPLVVAVLMKHFAGWEPFVVLGWAWITQAIVGATILSRVGMEVGTIDPTEK